MLFLLINNKLRRRNIIVDLREISLVSSLPEQLEFVNFVSLLVHYVLVGTACTTDIFKFGLNMSDSHSFFSVAHDNHIFLPIF